MVKTSTVQTDISFDRVKQRAVTQIENNQKLREYLEKIISAQGSTCADLKLDDFIKDSGTVRVPVYIVDTSWSSFSGITRWDGVFQNNGWGGKVADRSIGLPVGLFVSDWLDSDTGDEKDAAALLIHEFTHWLTAHCLGKSTSPQYKVGEGYDEGDKVQKLIDWSKNEAK